jgi:hypothetical protein
LHKYSWQRGQDLPHLSASSAAQLKPVADECRGRDNEQAEAAHESARKSQRIAAVPCRGKDKDGATVHDHIIKLRGCQDDGAAEPREDISGDEALLESVWGKDRYMLKPKSVGDLTCDDGHSGADSASEAPPAAAAPKKSRASTASVASQASRRRARRRKGLAARARVQQRQHQQQQQHTLSLLRPLQQHVLGLLLARRQVTKNNINKELDVSEQVCLVCAQNSAAMSDPSTFVPISVQSFEKEHAKLNSRLHVDLLRVYSAEGPTQTRGIQIRGKLRDQQRVFEAMRELIKCPLQHHATAFLGGFPSQCAHKRKSSGPSHLQSPGDDHAAGFSCCS